MTPTTDAPRLSDPRMVLRRSWMGDAGRLSGQAVELDNRVRARLRRYAPPNAPEWPYSVDNLLGQLRRAIRWNRWFIATCTCAQLGELIYGSRQGTMYPRERDASGDRRGELHLPLMRLRHACFHPAMNRTDGPLHVLILELNGLKGKDGALGGKLEKDHGILLEEPMTAFALHHLDRAGAFELARAEKSGFDRW